MSLHNISLLFLRLSISYIWLTAGLSKLFNSQFIGNFSSTLTSFAKDTYFSFYSEFLKQYIIPNASVFAQLTIWGEILTGIAFLLGFPMILAASVGIFMNSNYYLVATSAPSQFLNILLIFSQLTVYAAGAGSIFGLSAKLNKKK